MQAILLLDGSGGIPLAFSRLTEDLAVKCMAYEESRMINSCILSIEGCCCLANA